MMVNELLRVIRLFWPVILPIFSALESCGIPLPSEIFLPFAGAIIARQMQDIVVLVILGVVGDCIGAGTAYVVSVRYGKQVIVGPGRYIGLSIRHFNLAHKWVTKYGVIMMFVGQLLPVIRTYISFVGGVARLRPLIFWPVSVIGMIIWNVVFIVAGFILRSRYTLIFHAIPSYVTWILVAVLIALVVGWIAAGRRAPEEE
jgi:membrane protein DedA with SNARE-associated domain